jgi:hypothetical protein
MAYRAGLAVLPPIALEKKGLVFPFIEHAQTLAEYLHSEADDKAAVLFDIVTDIQRAHRLGFIYGDRNAGNILISKDGFTHIDFDWAISGKTAKEFEIAEFSMHVLYNGGSGAAPLLAGALNVARIQYPMWFDVRKTNLYASRLAAMLYNDFGADAGILADQELLAQELLATKF